MQFHNLKPNKKHEKKKRVGRGGSRGTYSGRGQKGQKAHGGRKVPKSALRNIISRLPKLRGWKNLSKKEYIRISLSVLPKYAKEGIITRDAIARRAIDAKKEVKILSNGEINEAITVQGVKVSKAAAEKIKKAGGKVLE